MVRCAVESAVGLPEVGEVILIDDGSPDGAIDVCRQLEREYEKVKLLQHPGGVNRGAGASRNLGIQHAKFPFIAFLDADDWYLEHRFETDKRILSQDVTIDGVYNALGNYYERESLRQMWLEQGRPELLTLTGGVPTPEELPLVLLHAHRSIQGEFSTDTLTVRREFFDRVGLFHTQLRLQQDTHMWKRMSVLGRLAAGNITEPVGIRRVHLNNRMTRLDDHDQYMELWWSDLGQRFRDARVRAEVMQAYRLGYARFCASRGERLKTVQAIAGWLLREPNQLRRRYGFFDQTLRRAFGSSIAVDRFLSAKNRMVGCE